MPPNIPPDQAHDDPEDDADRTRDGALFEPPSDGQSSDELPVDEFQTMLPEAGETDAADSSLIDSSGNELAGTEPIFAESTFADTPSADAALADSSFVVENPDSAPSQDDVEDATKDQTAGIETGVAAQDMTFLPAIDQGLDATRTPTNGTDNRTGDDDDFSVDQDRLDGSGLSQPSSPSDESAVADSRTDSLKTARYQGVVKRIGRYEIVRLLGEGAFGYVFEAHDPQLDRNVAIKIAKALNTDNDVERFLREARAAAQLHHPNIVPVHEYGQVEDKHIIVYEFIAGETLKSYMQRKHPLDLDETLTLVRKIAEGLDYAHSKGIIHRDMKPDNVLIDEHGQPNIADFGCARSLDADVSLTLDGSIMGTPTYMSPEQAGGKSNVADGRTDIWSLGVMLYEMVSGEKPFSGKLNDLLFWIRNHDAPSLRKIEPKVPLDIETICNKCLQRELPDRFANAQLLADEIERYQRGEPILSRPISLLRRTLLWRKRNPAVAGLLGLVAAILIVSTTISSLLLWQARIERARRTATQMQSIRTAKPEGLPVIFESLQDSSVSVLPLLKQQLQDQSLSPGNRLRLRTAVISLDSDPATQHQLSLGSINDLLVVDNVGEFMLGRSGLRDQANAITDCLWPVATDSVGQHSAGERFRAATLLTKLDPQSENWNGIARDVAGYLIRLNDLEVASWLSAFEHPNVLQAIRPSLETAYRNRTDPDKSAALRTASLLATLFRSDPPYLIGLLESATDTQAAVLIDALRAGDDLSETLSSANSATALIERRLRKLQPTDSAKLAPAKVDALANLRVALAELSDTPDWSIFKSGHNPAIATEVIERIAPANVSFLRLAQTLQNETPQDTDIVASLILSLGQFSDIQISPSQRSSLQRWLLEQFRTNTDSRVHSAIRWLLLRWNFVDEVQSAEASLRSRDPVQGFHWHVDLDGNTFVIFEPVDRFAMGSTPKQMQLIASHSSRHYNEPRLDLSIPRRFGICTQEVTIAQYLRFEDYLIERWTREQQAENVSAERKELLADRVKLLRRSALRKRTDTSLPVTEVDYLRAMGYCRWASAEFDGGAGLVSNEKLQNAYEQGTALAIREKFILRTGYRLPTAGEWEYACRASTRTLRPTGDAADRTLSYAWCQENSARSLHVPGQLKPNPAGLFDILGNASEWCLNWYVEQPPTRPAENMDDVWLDFSDVLHVRSATREFRGGSFRSEIEDLRSAKRSGLPPNLIQTDLGFRLARTYAASSLPAQ